MHVRIRVGFAAFLATISASTAFAASDGHPDFEWALVFAARSQPGSFSTVNAPGNGPSLVGSGNMSFGWEPGLDAKVTFHAGDKDVTLRFLGGLNWTGLSSPTLVPTNSVIPTNPTLNIGGISSTVVQDYRSSIDTGELNVGRPLANQVDVFAGLRVLKLSEKLHASVDFTADPNIANVTWTADTIGAGPQLGAQAQFGDRAFVKIDGRAGLLWTTSDLTFDESQNIGALFKSASTTSDWAAVAELGIEAGVKMTPNNALKVGYRLLYIHNVPTAGASVAATNVDFGSTFDGTVGRSSEDIFVHAFTAGFTFSF